MISPQIHEVLIKYSCWLFRYADHIEVGDEVLVQGNDELTPANVTNISSEVMQGEVYCSHSVR